MPDFIRTLIIPGFGDMELWAPFILRIGLGLAIIQHGYPKLFKNFGQFSGYVASLKWPAPKFFAALAAFVEFFGGITLIVGFMTKPAALIIALEMLLIILTAHRGQKFIGGWELSFLFLVGALALWAANSAGALALDSLIFGI